MAERKKTLKQTSEGKFPSLMFQLQPKSKNPLRDALDKMFGPEKKPKKPRSQK